MKNKIQRVIDEVDELLKKNKEWESRYNEYINGIDVQMNENRRCRKLFRVTRPLYIYSSISKAKESKYEYDLRFKGQSIATIKVIEDNVYISSKDKPNNEYFGVNTTLDNEKWNSSKASLFRKEFQAREISDKKGKSPEHEIESRLLSEFSEKLSANKELPYIQPITINGQYFQMPTPLQASKTPITYAGAKGGGIDILARIKVKDQKANENNRLVVFEVKDQNEQNEPVDKVILQAVAYATFIANLLKSVEGWWKLFGFSQTPTSKDIYVCTLMPMPTGKTISSFEEMEFNICGGYKLKLHTLYFDDKLNFGGSLREIMLKQNETHNP